MASCQLHVLCFREDLYFYSRGFLFSFVTRFSGCIVVVRALPVIGALYTYTAPGMLGIRFWGGLG